jgi:hypothetical protein
MVIVVTLAAVLMKEGGTGMPSSSTMTVEAHAWVDPLIVTKAKEWFYRFQSGKLDRSQLNAEVNAELTPRSLAVERSRLAPLGKPNSFAFLGSEIVNGATGYDFALTFARAKVVESIAFDSSGKIAGIDFQVYVPR